MASGHGAEYGGIRTPAELKKMLAEGDTGKLTKRPYTTDFSHDVALAFGISVDAHTVYGDRQYVADIRSGKVRVPGMSPSQLIHAHCLHEVTEKAIDDGDNPVDLYEGAHPFAEIAEHEEVKRVRGNDRGYEEALEPAINACYRRDPENPPRDLWCSPLLDEPTKRDKEILRIYRAHGVTDASKMSKRAVAYGFGTNQCRDCVHFHGESPGLCDIVSGYVRADRQCERWEARKKKD